MGAASDDSNFLTADEVALRLGVTTRTIRAWMRQSPPIPAIRVGARSIRFSWAAVQMWLDASPSKPTFDADEFAIRFLNELVGEGLLARRPGGIFTPSDTRGQNKGKEVPERS